MLGAQSLQHLAQAGNNPFFKEFLNLIYFLEFQIFKKGCLLIFPIINLKDSQGTTSPFG